MLGLPMSGWVEYRGRIMQTHWLPLRDQNTLAVCVWSRDHAMICCCYGDRHGNRAAHRLPTDVRACIPIHPNGVVARAGVVL